MISTEISINVTRKLTGNFYFKPSIFGFILLVEESSKYNDGEMTKSFRRASYEDIFKLGLINSKTSP